MMGGRTKRQLYALPLGSMKSTKSNKINSFLARLLSPAENLHTNIVWTQIRNDKMPVLNWN